MTTTAINGYVLDSGTGALSDHSVKVEPGGPKVTRVGYDERFLESLIVLNPSIVGADGHLPLVAHGGQSSPDLIFRDDIGRFVVVECKQGTAKPEDLIQLLGYGHQLPFEGERTLYSDLLGVDIAMVRPGGDALKTACTNVFEMDRRDSVDTAKAAVDKALKTGPRLDALTVAARERLGLMKLEAPIDRFVTNARMVLVAPRFRPDCIDLCRALTARTIDVSLVGVDVLDSPDGRVVVRTVVHEPEEMHAVRDAIGHVWRSARARSLLSPLGWVYAKENPSFKFTGRGQRYVTIELLAGDPRVVAMRIPHSTFDKEVVAEMKSNLNGRLMAGFEQSRSDWVWEGAWSAEEWAGVAIKVADAAHRALASSG